MVRRWSLLLAALATGRVASASSEADAPCRTLTATRFEQRVEVFVGHRPPLEAASPPWSFTHAACGGCGAGDPVVDLTYTRDATGAWSAAQIAFRDASGLPFEHRQQLYALRRRDEADTPSDYVVAPLSAEHGLVRHLVPAAEGCVVHAIAALDRWSAVLAEQASTGGLLLRTIGSEGAHAEDLVVDHVSAWDPDWPAATGLIGVDGTSRAMAVFGRNAGTGDVHVEVLEGTARRSAPPIDCARADLAAGLWVKGAPAVAVGSRHGVKLFRLDDGQWRESGGASGAASMSCDRAPDAVAAVGVGRDRDEVVALLLCDEALQARSLRDGAWGEPVRLPLAVMQRPFARPRTDASLQPHADGVPSWLLPALGALAGIAGLALLLLRRLRSP